MCSDLLLDEIEQEVHDFEISESAGKTQSALFLRVFGLFDVFERRVREQSLDLVDVLVSDGPDQTGVTLFASR